MGCYVSLFSFNLESYFVVFHDTDILKKLYQVSCGQEYVYQQEYTDVGSAFFFFFEVLESMRIMWSLNLN